MNKSKSSQYLGPITPKQAAEGMEAASSNAKDLFKEAEILLKNQCYPRAFALAVLAIEEAGKLLIIKEILCANNDSELKKSWRSYRSHTEKNLMWPTVDLIKNGATKLKDFLPLFLKDSDDRVLLDLRKQQALYSDVDNNCNWSQPKDVVDKKMAENMIFIAKILVHSKERYSEPILKIWVKFMKLPESTSAAGRMLALLSFYKEAEKQKLVKAGSCEEMEKFILVGLKGSKL